MAPKGSQPPPGPAFSHGLTPPMRDARRRHFRQRIEAPPHVVTRVEADLLAIIRVRPAACKPIRIWRSVRARILVAEPVLPMLALFPHEAQQRTWTPKCPCLTGFRWNTIPS